MRMLVTLTALAAIMAAPSFAQTATTGKHSAVMMADHTMRASKLVGLTVFNNGGDVIGTVDEILVTAGAVEPIAIVSVGGFLGEKGDKLISEPLSHLKLSRGDKMMMPDATKATISARAPYQYKPSLMGGGG